MGEAHRTRRNRSLLGRMCGLSANQREKRRAGPRVHVLSRQPAADLDEPPIDRRILPADGRGVVDEPAHHRRRPARSDPAMNRGGLANRRVQALRFGWCIAGSIRLARKPGESSYAVPSWSNAR